MGIAEKAGRIQKGKTGKTGRKQKPERENVQSAVNSVYFSPHPP